MKRIIKIIGALAIVLTLIYTAFVYQRCKSPSGQYVMLMSERAQVMFEFKQMLDKNKTPQICIGLESKSECVIVYSDQWEEQKGFSSTELVLMMSLYSIYVIKEKEAMEQWASSKEKLSFTKSFIKNMKYFYETPLRPAFNESELAKMDVKDRAEAYEVLRTEALVNEKFRIKMKDQLKEIIQSYKKQVQEYKREVANI